MTIVTGRNIWSERFNVWQSMSDNVSNKNNVKPDPSTNSTKKRWLIPVAKKKCKELYIQHLPTRSNDDELIVKKNHIVRKEILVLNCCGGNKRLDFWTYADLVKEGSAPANAVSVIMPADFVTSIYKGVILLSWSTYCITTININESLHPTMLTISIRALWSIKPPERAKPSEKTTPFLKKTKCA